jgi:hypothetical protein
MAERPSWLELLKRSQDAVPKWPPWIHWLGGAYLLLFVMFGLGLLGNRPYVVLAAVWLLFCSCLFSIRKAAPQFPEFGVFAGWFFLAGMGAFIAYLMVVVQP